MNSIYKSIIAQIYLGLCYKFKIINYVYKSSNSSYGKMNKQIIL